MGWLVRRRSGCRGLDGGGLALIVGTVGRRYAFELRTVGRRYASELRIGGLVTREAGGKVVMG